MHLEKKLCAAIEKGDRDSAISLIEAGANVDGIVDGKVDVPPLNLACARGDIELVELLIKKGASLNQVDTHGYSRTPLHHACKKGKSKVAEFLLKKGAEINARESHGKTPLYLACEAGHTQIVGLLIKNQADLNIPDNYKILPLLLSVAYHKPRTADLLKKNGAKFFASDDKEETWSYLAQHRVRELAKRVIEAVLSQNPKEKKPNVIFENQVLSSYWDEVSSLKSVIFKGITLFDIPTIRNEDKLQTLSCHAEIKRIINQPDFIERHPCYGTSIKENLKKGWDRSALIEKLITNEILHNQVFSSESKKVSLDNDVKRKVFAYLSRLDLASLHEAACRVNKSGVKTALAPTMQNDSKPETTLLAARL